MITSLTKTVKFRVLAGKLSNTEFNQLLSKFTQTYGKNIILSALCNQFLKSTHSELHSNQLNSILEITSNIIESRTIIPTESTRNIKIDTLPGNLLGEIASYLYHNDHIHFSQSNRIIYIGCNSPNTLQQLYSTSRYHNTSLMNLQKFSLLNQLTTNFSKISKLSSSMVNHLQKLGLIDDTFDDAGIDSLIAAKQINFNNLKTLSIASLNGVATFKLFTKFAMIEHLSLQNMFIDEVYMNSKISKLFPNLQAFSWSQRISGYRQRDHMFGYDIINSYSNNLQYLKLDGPNIEIGAGLKFDKVTQLQLIEVPFNVDKMLKKMKNLTKINISQETRFKLTELICDQPLLEYIEIRVNDWNAYYVLQQLENGLLQTKKRNRKHIKIKLFLECCDRKMKMNDTTFEKKMPFISRITNVLQASNVKDFMLLIYLWGRSPDNDRINKAIEDLNFKVCKQSKVVVKMNESVYTNEIVITNEHCKINGYSESWLFN